MFGIDRHPHSFVGIAEFVGQRVAGEVRHGLGPVRGAQRIDSVFCNSSATQNVNSAAFGSPRVWNSQVHSPNVVRSG